MASPAPTATPAPTAAPTPAPVPAAAPAPEASPAAPAPTTTVVPSEPATPPKRSLTEKILGRKLGTATDVEKQNTPEQEAAETRHKKKLAAAGILGSIATILLSLLGMMLLTSMLFTISSYITPMLSCKMHGYNSQCMFNPYDKAGNSIGEWFSENLPGKLGGFHRQGW